MFVLDTDVISEITRLRPDGGVVRWLEKTPRAALCLPSVVIAALFAGIEILPEGRKRDALHGFVSDFVATTPRENLLVFGVDEALRYAAIVAMRREHGREVKQLDAQIASIAATNRMPIVTRNVRDFEHCGIEIVNPWEAAA
jgi:predicted nucleic acid-binding protein